MMNSETIPHSNDPSRPSPEERLSEWRTLLGQVTRERLLRECRRELVMNEPKQARVLATTLLDRAGDEDQCRELGRALGRALADMYQDRDKGRKLLEGLTKSHGAVGLGAHAAVEQFAAELRLGDRGMNSSQQAWTRSLTEAIMKLTEALPGRNELGEPTEEQFKGFLAECALVLRAGSAQSDPQEFIDSLNVLVEFCPVDEAAVKSAAGVEERMFIRLGPRARLTAVRALRRLGESEQVRQMVLKLAGRPEGQGRDRHRMLTGIMGGMGHSDSFDPLMKILAHAKGTAEESWALDALSRIGHEKVPDVMLERLEKVVRKLGEKDNLRRADELLRALGRLTRLKGIDTARRNAIVKATIRIVDKAERQVACMAAQRLFVSRPEDLKMELRIWAVDKCVDALWGQPFSPVAGGAAANGWRQPIVQTLIRMGQELLPEVIEQADRYKARYSGGMAALADVLEQIGDFRAAPLLEALIRSALMHDETQVRSYLHQEKVVDAATGEQVELDRDELIFGMMQTLLKVGGDEGRDTILGFADQLQAGRLAVPGDKTGGLLGEVKMRHGDLGRISQKAHCLELSPKELESTISEARGGLLARKAKRIAAMATLGQTRDPEAIEVLVEGLGDKDTMVACAAHTALAQFLSPPPAPEEFERFVAELLGNPKKIKGLMDERFYAFVDREMPKNAPYDKLFERQLTASVEDKGMAHRLRGAMKRGAEPPRAVPEKSDREEEPGGQARPPDAVPMTELDKKRAYMQARKAWIDGGKQGDPPEPPK